MKKYRYEDTYRDGDWYGDYTIIIGEIEEIKPVYKTLVRHGCYTSVSYDGGFLKFRTGNLYGVKICHDCIDSNFSETIAIVNSDTIARMFYDGIIK